jgi:hypothetical protein
MAAETTIVSVDDEPERCPNWKSSGFPVRAHQLMTYGEPERVLAAWGADDASFDSVPADRKRPGQLISY